MPRLFLGPRRRTRNPSRPRVEAMEDRLLLATFTVINTDDSGPGSLRQAIADANAATNPAGDVDTIAFNIPGAGVHSIRPATNLPWISDPVTIDGYTQPGAGANTNPTTAASDAVLLIELDGSFDTHGATGTYGDGLVLTGGGTTVRGLAINRFTDLGIEVMAGGDNTIAGDYIGTNPAGTAVFENTNIGILTQTSNNTIGGTSPADRNIISGSRGGDYAGLLIKGDTNTTGNLVQGNFIGTDATGTIALGSSGEGVHVAGPSGVTIGGTIPGARNLISGNSRFGIDLEGSGAVVQGNLIGTDITGRTRLGNGEGIFLNSTGDEIGGTTPGAGNIISGNNLIGIDVDRVSGDLIQGNFIGTDDTATIDVGNGDYGVALHGSTDISIGGTTAGAGNVIAFTANGDGVLVVGAGNSILGNSIFENGSFDTELGIRRTALVVNPPVLTSATVTSIVGTLSGPADTTFRLEFFATPVTGSKATPQGKTFLGTMDVPTDGTGAASFTFSPSGGVPAGPYLTATATASSGTSEFSQAITIPAVVSADLAVAVTDAPDPVAAGGTITYTITVTNDGSDAASGVGLVDHIPAGTTFVSFTAPAGWAPIMPAADGTGTVSATADSLSAGADAVFTLVVRVDPGAADGSTITDSVSTSTSRSTDSDSGNDTDSATTTVGAGAPKSTTADLSVTQSAAPGTATVGHDDVTFTVTVTDQGPDPASNVTLTEALPAGAAFISATGGVTPSKGTLNFVLGDLAVGASRTVTIVVRPRSAGTLTASATVSAAEADPTTGNNTAAAAAVAAAPTPTPSATPAAPSDGPPVLSLGSSAFVVRGAATAALRVRFDWVLRLARYNNEVGLVRVDDASGRIGGLGPGDPGYLRAALTPGRWQRLFAAGTRVPASRVLTFHGGDHFLVYIVQNRSTRSVISRLNSASRLTSHALRPRTAPVFFMDKAANPDHFDHVHVQAAQGVYHLNWEDLLRGGDRDFNDVVLTIQAEG